MHAGFPCFYSDLQKVMRMGSQQTPDFIDSVAGPMVAGGLALLLELGFGYILRDCLASEQQAKKALEFFDENFVFRSPNVSGGLSYYQGKFLLCTRKPGDDMNVWLRFCPEPGKLFQDSVFGRNLDSSEVVKTKVVDEKEAAKLERDPDKVDLVIRFKDVDSILGLAGRDNVDIVGLLLENTVQLTGNVGHLFKLGAIATNISKELGLDQQH